MSLLDPGQLVPASAPRRIRMTEREFLALEGVHAEYVNGEAEFMSPVPLRHSTLSSWLVAVAQVCASRTGAGQVFGEPVACRTSSDHLRSPDICFVSTARAMILKPSLIDGAPELIMEVVSPESRHRDYYEKYAEYEAAGAREYWLFDPVYETVDLHRLAAAGRYQHIPPDQGQILPSAELPYFEFMPAWMVPGRLPDLGETIVALMARIPR